VIPEVRRVGYVINVAQKEAMRSGRTEKPAKNYHKKLPFPIIPVIVPRVP
jgi:hypothetical protein